MRAIAVAGWLIGAIVPALATTPFYLERKVVVKDVTGKLRVVTTRFSGVRADGTRVSGWHGTQVDGMPVSQRSVFFLDGTVVHTNDYIQAKAEKPSERMFAHWPDPARQCLEPREGRYGTPPKLMGREKIFGVETVQLKFERSGGTSVEWRAPSLGCELIQERSEVRDGKTGKTVSTQETIPTLLRLMEPHPSLFLVLR